MILLSFFMIKAEHEEESFSYCDRIAGEPSTCGPGTHCFLYLGFEGRGFSSEISWRAQGHRKGVGMWISVFFKLNFGDV